MTEKFNPWQELVQTCVLGSGRSQTVISAPGLLGAVIADLQAHSDASLKAPSQEEKLLMALAATALAMRAGQIALGAAELPPAPPPCAIESHESCGQYSLTLLNHALAEQPSGGDTRRLSLVRDWLGFCLESKKIIPGDYLPKLMDFASGKPELHQLLSQCGGHHFAWLVDLNRDWQAAFLGTTGSAEPNEALIEQIELGSDKERIAAFRLLRQAQPALARDCLISLWEKESAEQKQLFLKALNCGLSMDDEMFLEETALVDRRKEVRRAAISLLAALPGSRYLARMKERAAAFLTVKDKKGMAISLPKDFDPSMTRDEMEETSTIDSRIGQKAGWLYQVISLVDPSFWYRHTGLSAGAFCQLVVASEEWSLPIVLGLLNATALFGHSQFQDALLSFEDIHLTESLPGKYFLSKLPPDKLERLITSKLPSWAQTDRRAAPRLDLWYYLELVDFAWSEAFSLQLLQFIIKEIKEKVPVFGHTFYSNASTFGLRMHASAGRLLEGLNLAEAEIDTWTRGGLERFFDTLKLRYEMQKSFQNTDSG